MRFRFSLQLKFLKDVEARLEAERDEAFRGGQKLEESLRELAQDFETVSDQVGLLLGLFFYDEFS